MAVRLSGALWNFWYRHGHLSEGRRWLETALALPGQVPDRARARVLNDLATLMSQQGDYAQAKPLLTESLSLWRAVGDHKGVARTLNDLGAVAFFGADYHAALAFFMESLLK